MEQKVAEKPSLTLTRRYPVAPEKVWRAWTDPEAIKKWWGQGGNEPVAAGTELVFTLEPVVDPRERDAWRGDFKRLGQLLQQTD